MNNDLFNTDDLVINVSFHIKDNWNSEIKIVSYGVEYKNNKYTYFQKEKGVIKIFGESDNKPTDLSFKTDVGKKILDSFNNGLLKKSIIDNAPFQIRIREYGSYEKAIKPEYDALMEKLMSCLVKSKINDMLNKITKNNDLIISKNIKNCYLVYTGDNYIFINPKNTDYNITEISIKDNPSVVEETLVFKDNKISNNDNYNGSFILIKTHLEYSGFSEKEQEHIIQELFYDLAEVYYYNDNKEETDDFDKISRFKQLTNEIIVNKIDEIINKSIGADEKEIFDKLIVNFKERKRIEWSIKELGNYLNEVLGVILRENTHDIYILDNKANAYNSITVDELIIRLKYIFKTKNLFNTDDVKKAVGYISDRLKPEYNIVKFNNCVYSMQEHDIIETDKPVFTLIECPYNYNANAKPKYIKNFLYSSLKQSTEEETDHYVQGVLEYIGYLFTSGNNSNILGWIIGKAGGGKSTFANIIQAIFNNKCSDLDFSEIEKNPHSTAILVDNHLNIVREASNKTVYNNKYYKTLRGNEPIPVNPKYQSPYMLPTEEVPKSTMVANNIPQFKNPEPALLQSFLIVEFKKSFRNTSKQIKDLDKLIINSKSDMEWLIYESLKAYKNMVANGNQFILQLSEKDTLDLVEKHSKPLNYLINKLISKHDKEAYESEITIYDSETKQGEFMHPYIIINELQQALIELANIEGVELPVTKTNKVSGKKLLQAIKEEFNLDTYQIEVNGSFINYNTIVKRINGKSVRIYPELLKSDLYNDILKQLNNN